MVNNLTVVKDNKMIQASYKLTLVEQRIILSAIAKIDSTLELSKDQGFTIRVAEIQDLFTDTKSKTSNYGQIREGVDRLYKRTILLDKNGRERRWIYEKEYNENEGSITIFFSPTIIPYLSQLKSNFTQYKLQWIKSFSSPYSIRIYELLCQWTSKGEREVELEWLKQTLGIEGKYERTNNFIARVIKPSIDDINEYSNLLVQYQTKKYGKVITHIQFKFDFKVQVAAEPKKIIEQPIKQKHLTLEQFVSKYKKETTGKNEFQVRQMMTSSKYK